MSDNRTADPNPWAVGFIAFAAFMLILTGFYHAIAGLIAIIDEEFYLVTNNYVFQFDISTWGWINLIVGIVAILAGFYLFSGAVWARTVGVLAAMSSAITAFAWMPYASASGNSLWSLIVILISVFTIWALVVHGRDLAIDE